VSYFVLHWYGAKDHKPYLETGPLNFVFFGWFYCLRHRPVFLVDSYFLNKRAVSIFKVITTEDGHRIFISSVNIH